MIKTIFDVLIVSYSEYEYFKNSTAAKKMNFLFELYDSRIVDSGQFDLSDFFDSVHQNLKSYVNSYNEQSLPQPEHPELDSTDFVDVTIDDSTIMIESNSLRATKHVIYQFVEAGYILRRDIATEKMFKKDKLTRYIRIFKIINQALEICPN
jgi:hypothetical protein